MKEIIFALVTGASLLTGVPVEKVESPINYVVNIHNDTQTVAELHAADNYYANYDIASMEKRAKETLKHIGEMSIADSEKIFVDNLSAYVVSGSPAEKNVVKLYHLGNRKEVTVKIADIEVFPEDLSFQAHATIQVSYKGENGKERKVPLKVELTFKQKSKESVFMLEDATVKPF